jgi:hypothetical protein
MIERDVRLWTVTEVGDFLSAYGIPEDLIRVIEGQEFDGFAALNATEQLIQHPTWLALGRLGPRTKVWAAFRDLQISVGRNPTREQSWTMSDREMERLRNFHNPPPPQEGSFEAVNGPLRYRPEVGEHRGRLLVSYLSLTAVDWITDVFVESITISQQ